MPSDLERASASRRSLSNWSGLDAPVKRPVSLKSQSMPSWAMNCTRSSRAALASACMAMARASPKRRIISESGGRRLPLAMPPLREEAPSPGRILSNT